MKLVIDVNCIISALIRDSISREIIVRSSHRFYTPDHTYGKLQKYRELICEKSGLNNEDYDIMLTQIMRIVETIPKSYYEKELPHAKGLMGSVDIEDVPFIALALKMDVPIWSDDKHFEEQNKVKILKTRDIIELSE